LSQNWGQVHQYGNAFAEGDYKDSRPTILEGHKIINATTMIINKEWLEKQKTAEGEDKPDEYVLTILKVGEKVLDLMEALGDKPIDANELILQADKELNESITGNMAAYVAFIATKCHSRGEEFKKSWNKHNGREDAKSVINPAVITIKT
jgi:hypothetical protein